MNDKCEFCVKSCRNLWCAYANQRGVMKIEDAIREVEMCIKEGLHLDWVAVQIVLEYAKNMREAQIKERN